MNKLWCFSGWGMLLAILLLQLRILDELERPRTFHINAPVKEAGQPTLLDLQKHYAEVEARYFALQVMTQKEWEAEGKALGEKARMRAPTLEAALAQNKKRLEELRERINALSARNP